MASQIKREFPTFFAFEDPNATSISIAERLGKYEARDENVSRLTLNMNDHADSGDVV